MYYPKSHITPNLYSNGELSIIGSNTPYIGYYFSTISKQNFTGRFPGDGDNLELSKLPELSSSPDTGDEFDDYRFYGRDNELFSKLNGATPLNLQKYPPTPFYPQPSEQDYQLGEFTRYFSKKTNENKYTETSGLFENSLYIGIQLPWLITGDRDEVIRVNQNIVKLREQQLNISGLGEYLKFNYLKFYSPGETQSNLSTDGTEFKNRRTGIPYSGPYHIHPQKGPMVGAVHISASHDYLDPLPQQPDITTPGSISSTTTPTPTPVIRGGGGSYGGGGGGGGGY